MSKTIAIIGAGPGLGQAVAHRYASDGYDVALVARRRGPLEALAQELTDAGGRVRAVPGDLADADGVLALAGRIREAIGDPGVLYYGPTAGGLRPATSITAEGLRSIMYTLYSLVDLVDEFLPSMLDRRDGAVLFAGGATAIRGLPNLSGPGPTLAAQRNYLQSLHGEVADRGVYVGALYIGAVIEGSAFHIQSEEAEAAGRGKRWGATVDPGHLADLLRGMHEAKDKAEAGYPETVSEGLSA